jgi:hypothetical protein
MRTLLVVLLAVTAAPAFAADWKLDCPREISTAQSVAGPLPAGWSAYARSTSDAKEAAPGAATTASSPPVSVSVFDGPPSEMADLVPDNPNAKVQRWTFGKTRMRDIYVVCNYLDTRMKLAQKVPAAVTSCALAAKDGAATGVVCR